MPPAWGGIASLQLLLPDVARRIRFLYTAVVQGGLVRGII